MNVPSPKPAARLAALSAAIALACMVASGCSNPYADICERGAVCRGSNDRDIDACIIQQESNEQVASIYGCDNQWNDYIDCMVANGSCMGDKLSGCDAFKDQWKRCIP